MNESLKVYLKQSGYKLTPPRLAVFCYLQTNHPAPISAIIVHSSPDIDRASVYRTLELFRKLEIIQDIVQAGKRVVDLKDRFGEHHHHIACTKCQKSESIHDTTLEQGLVRLAKQHNFELSEHHLELSGLCADCK